MLARAIGLLLKTLYLKNIIANLGKKGVGYRAIGLLLKTLLFYQNKKPALS